MSPWTEFLLVIARGLRWTVPTVIVVCGIWYLCNRTDWGQAVVFGALGLLALLFISFLVGMIGYTDDDDDEKKNAS